MEFGLLLVGIGIGWLVGFVHRGWLAEQEEREREALIRRLHQRENQ